MPHVDTVIDGKKAPSVTEAIGILDKPFLYRWYGMNGWAQCQKILKEKQDNGIKFHASVEQALKYHFGFIKEEPNWDENVEVVIRWADRVGFTPTEFEKHVVSRKHFYGGTYDCLGTIPKIGWVMPDWKLTSQISETYALQLAGYYQAHYEETGERIVEGRVIRPYELKTVAKKDEIKETANGWKHSFYGLNVYIEERIYKDLGKDVENFLACLKIWNRLNKKDV